MSDIDDYFLSQDRKDLAEFRQKAKFFLDQKRFLERLENISKRAEDRVLAENANKVLIGIRELWKIQDTLAQLRSTFRSLQESSFETVRDGSVEIMSKILK